MRSSESSNESSALIDKDPMYRTNDIFNGVFGKSIKLKIVDENGASSTDCQKNIWLNFNQPVVRQIGELAHQEDGRNIYHLSCGHLFRSGRNTTHAEGKNVPCFRCGSAKVYRTLEHEWSHIIFKSDPQLYKLFIDEYTRKLTGEGYSALRLPDFLHLIINALDDIRVNSLLQFVYEGAAYEIWEKWKNICEEDDEITNENPIALMFAVALNARNVDPDGPFGELIPTMQEATNKVRGKGPGNMLVVARWFVDTCVRKMIEKEQQENQQGQDQGQQQQAGPPGPQPSGNQDPTQGGGDQQNGQSPQQAAPQPQNQSQQDPAQGGQQGPQSQQQDPQKGQNQTQQQSQGSKGGEEGDQQGSSPYHQSVARALQRRQQSTENRKDTAQKSQALSMLAQSAAPVDDEEEHHTPTGPPDADAPQMGNAAAVSYALSADISTEDAVDAKIQKGHMDTDVRTAVDQLRNTVRTQSPDAQLTSTAKANILLVDVKPRNIDPDHRIVLDGVQRAAVTRMRSAFTKVMGRQQAKMDSDGLVLDVESAIQYMVDPTQTDIFEEEQINKGFAYLILCDMSGSMSGNPFNNVCVGAEMLKKALDYPFVQGWMWGFRGAIDRRQMHRGSNRQDWASAVTRRGEIWLYRYDKNCPGYLGEAKVGRSRRVPVECDGLTPMNSAVHVALKYLTSHVPVGMAKRLFLLTDGNPTHVKSSGKQLSDKFLRNMVAKEIREGRQRGIDTYSFVIGSSVKDQHALEMFGPRRFWERIDKENSIDKALVRVIQTNFVKYLKGA